MCQGYQGGWTLDALRPLPSMLPNFWLIHPWLNEYLPRRGTICPYTERKGVHTNPENNVDLFSLQAIGKRKSRASLPIKLKRKDFKGSYCLLWFPSPGLQPVSPRLTGPALGRVVKWLEESDSLPLPRTFSHFLPAHPEYLPQGPLTISPKHSVDVYVVMFIRFHLPFSPTAQCSRTHLSTSGSPEQCPVRSGASSACRRASWSVT